MVRIPVPPTGGQGGHYGHNPPPPPKIFHRKGRRHGKRAPHRFRNLRLRRRTRSRYEPVNPFMTALLIVMIAIPVLFILSALLSLDLPFSSWLRP